MKTTVNNTTHEVPLAIAALVFEQHFLPVTRPSLWLPYKSWDFPQPEITELQTAPPLICTIDDAFIGLNWGMNHRYEETIN